MEQETQTPHKRRVRYKGKYPRKFEEKYKELNPEKYKDTIEHVISKGKDVYKRQMPLVRETCAEDKCHAYNHNWTCPPACGTLDECESRMRAYKRGILVQTTGVLRRDIDTRIYRETEQLHTEYLKVLR